MNKQDKEIEEIKSQIEEIKSQVEETFNKKRKKITVCEERLDTALFAFSFIFLISLISITRAVDIIDRINPSSSFLSLFVVVALIILLSYVFKVIIKYLIR